MPISVTTSDQYNLSVVLNDGNTVNLTTSATSVAVSQASPINITVSSKGPKGDPGVGGSATQVVTDLNGMTGTINIAPVEGSTNVDVTDDGSGNIYIDVDDFSYTNATAMPEAVGGWPSGSTFTDKTLQDMFDGLLYPYQEPSFSSFSLADISNTREVGSSIPANSTYTFTASNTSNINAGSVNITYSGTSSGTIATGLNINQSPYDASHSAIANSTAGNLTFKVEATNSQGGLFSKTYTVSYRWRVYWGNSALDSLTEADIKGLDSSDLKTSKNGTYGFTTATNQYKYLCWPNDFGSPIPVTGFKDAANGNSIVMATSADDSFFSNTHNGWSYGVVSVTNSNNVTTNYRVYRSKNKLGSALSITVS